MKKLFVILLMVLLMGCLVQGVFAEWTVEHFEDIVTGKPVTVLMSIADQHQGTSSSPVLGIRKDHGDIVLFVAWTTVMDKSLPGVVALIGNPNLNEREILWGTISNDGKGLFFDSPQDLIDRMLLEERFVLVGSSYTGADMIGVWDISGLKDITHLIK